MAARTPGGPASRTAATPDQGGTGGSNGISSVYNPLRQACATARQALTQWEELKTKDLMKEIQTERVRLMVVTDQLEQDERRMKHMQVVAANFVLPAGDREDAK